MTKLHANPTVAACKLTIPAPYDFWLCGWQIIDPFIEPFFVAICTHTIHKVRMQRINRRLPADRVVHHFSPSSALFT
jgi:hypothetical protein